MYAWLSFSRSTSFLVLCPFLYYIASFACFTFSKNIFFHGYNVRHGESTDRNWYKTVYYHYSHNGVVILLFVSYANNGNIRIYRKSMRSFNDQIVSIKQGRCKCFTLVNNSCFNRYWLKCSDELHSLVFRSMLPPGFSFFFRVLRLYLKWWWNEYTSSTKDKGEECSKKSDLVRIHLRTIIRADRDERKKRRRKVFNLNAISNDHQ